MSQVFYSCWECGQAAPAGVCTRPHPRYNWLGANARKNVVPPRGMPVGRGYVYGGAADEEWEPEPWE